MTILRHALAYLVLITGLLAPSVSARAVEADELLADPVLEARARKLSAELRCLVCQNQSIDDSNAPLAKDLRVIVRERLTAGDTDAQIMAFVVDRYGEFVLLRPRLGAHTLLLWGAAPALLAIAGFLIWRRGRQAAQPEVAPLSAEEERRLEQLLKRNDDHAA